MALRSQDGFCQHEVSKISHECKCGGGEVRESMQATTLTPDAEAQYLQKIVTELAAL